ncbi:DUF2288 domain-containing protein [Zhongshania borealis]|jgi:hypothetical protein|uniref:DUF2288 domain-containing protein n=1 Tax=Zhongshania borealis TaxID=889488 RepID=A0ABP7WAW7_9GAMM|tara:strand:- start:2006 stop:2320 length:315 start_codon:yes stop_codon:yes gene_type:complete
MSDLPSELMIKLNRETSKIDWQALQRFYAQGAVLVVAPSLDLVATAAAVAEDNSAYIADLLKQDLLKKADEAQAATWLADKCEVWAVVVAPWVLVQRERKLADE